MSDSKLDMVFCSNCKQGDPFVKGSLSEEQKAGYLCSVCREAVLETRVERKSKKGKQVLLG